MKYTPEMLRPIVSESFSYSEVVRKLGLRPHGGTNDYIKRVIMKFGIDAGHFTGSFWARGKKGGTSGFIPAYKILVLRHKNCSRQPSHKLRRALLEIGRPYECEECGLLGVWNNKTLILQVDHRNGKVHDDREENLRFICPNCHSQTPNFGSRNSGNRQTGT
jgi:predicted RNA-binding Zn-ribbon protein involved in translation (DUF1610 family)